MTFQLLWIPPETVILCNFRFCHVYFFTFPRRGFYVLDKLHSVTQRVVTKIDSRSRTHRINDVVDELYFAKPFVPLDSIWLRAGSTSMCGTMRHSKKAWIIDKINRINRSMYMINGSNFIALIIWWNISVF